MGEVRCQRTSLKSLESCVTLAPLGLSADVCPVSDKCPLHEPQLSALHKRTNKHLFCCLLTSALSYEINNIRLRFDFTFFCFSLKVYLSVHAADNHCGGFPVIADSSFKAWNVLVTWI